ncbi:MAG: ABC transporter ATP-binding protein [Spirochaetales bacterium]
MSNPILEVRHISKRFGGVQAVEDFSLSLSQGGIVSIIGPNGAGKTTVFNLISGVYPLDRGEVFLKGERISGLPQHLVTRKGIARTFQNIRLFQGLTVLENVLTALDPHSPYTLIDTLFTLPRRKTKEKEAKHRAFELLALVGLGDYAEEQPSNLPYGLQRKLEIARALAAQPTVLLLDEPAAGLNPREVQDFIQLIYKLHQDHTLSILLIEHRMQVVMEMSDWIYVMNFGKLLAEGEPHEVQKNPEVIKAYIGEEEAC